MQINRFYVEMMASSLRGQVMEFREKHEMFKDSQHNRENAVRWGQEAERLQAILTEIDGLLEGNRQSFTLE